MKWKFARMRCVFDLNISKGSGAPSVSARRSLGIDPEEVRCTASFIGCLPPRMYRGAADPSSQLTGRLSNPREAPTLIVHRPALPEAVDAARPAFRPSPPPSSASIIDPYSHRMPSISPRTRSGFPRPHRSRTAVPRRTNRTDAPSTIKSRVFDTESAGWACAAFVGGFGIPRDSCRHGTVEGRAVAHTARGRWGIILALQQATPTACGCNRRRRDDDLAH